jgi:hypothetical protein
MTDRQHITALQLALIAEAFAFFAWGQIANLHCLAR